MSKVANARHVSKRPDSSDETVFHEALIVSGPDQREVHLAGGPEEQRASVEDVNRRSRDGIGFLSRLNSRALLASPTLSSPRSHASETRTQFNTKKRESASLPSFVFYDVVDKVMLNRDQSFGVDKPVKKHKMMDSIDRLSEHLKVFPEVLYEDSLPERLQSAVEERIVHHSQPQHRNLRATIGESKPRLQTSMSSVQESPAPLTWAEEAFDNLQHTRVAGMYAASDGEADGDAVVDVSSSSALMSPQVDESHLTPERSLATMVEGNPAYLTDGTDGTVAKNTIDLTFSMNEDNKSSRSLDVNSDDQFTSSPDSTTSNLITALFRTVEARRLRDLVPTRVLQLLRSRGRVNRQRLQWKCSCGQAMYGDYAQREKTGDSLIHSPQLSAYARNTSPGVFGSSSLALPTSDFGTGLFSLTPINALELPLPPHLADRKNIFNLPYMGFRIGWAALSIAFWAAIMKMIWKLLPDLMTNKVSKYLLFRALRVGALFGGSSWLLQAYCFANGLQQRADIPENDAVWQKLLRINGPSVMTPKGRLVEMVDADEGPKQFRWQQSPSMHPLDDNELSDHQGSNPQRKHTSGGGKFTGHADNSHTAQTDSAAALNPTSSAPQQHKPVSDGQLSATQPAVTSSSPHRSFAGLPLAFKPCFFELCVNRSKTQITLGESQLVHSLGNRLIKTDMELFAQIRKRYDSARRKGLYRVLYRPMDIEFVRFGVHRGGYQTGIYEKPLAVPPAAEVRDEKYHYHECPLDPLPPIDSRTFFHYFWEHASHPVTSGSQAFDSLFFNRLPKKLGSSILVQTDLGKLQLGWGVHIIEGPNKPLLAWLATAILVLSFVISVSYDVGTKNRESGFAIGQWMVAVLATALTAVYFHLADIA
ncbi:hypothetical protein LTR37_013495 [Vermiconidia calcicola]|uniref:Uncharacterized protein n=1 Tax=Vermiconidia calcicola TaxID=1690605 RepID=A0ACC3MW59_9PEZI|nr:hypothetical protein LTR37_013495 [Vermiconidia calcicola]